MCYYYVDAMHDYKSNPTGAESITTLVFFIKEITMSIYRLKIKNIDNTSKTIPVLRRFDPSLSIADIRKRIEEGDYVVEYDLLHWEITEEIAVESVWRHRQNIVFDFLLIVHTSFDT